MVLVYARIQCPSGLQAAAPAPHHDPVLGGGAALGKWRGREKLKKTGRSDSAEGLQSQDRLEGWGPDGTARDAEQRRGGGDNPVNGDIRPARPSPAATGSQPWSSPSASLASCGCTCAARITSRTGQEDNTGQRAAPGEIPWRAMRRAETKTFRGWVGRAQSISRIGCVSYVRILLPSHGPWYRARPSPRSATPPAFCRELEALVTVRADILPEGGGQVEAGARLHTGLALQQVLEHLTLSRRQTTHTPWGSSPTAPLGLWPSGLGVCDGGLRPGNARRLPCPVLGL